MPRPFQPDPGPPPTLTPPTIAYIGAFGRSGSTLIERLLGAVPGATPVGELNSLFTHALPHNELCGCGVPFRLCPFWTLVGELAFDGWDRLDADELARLQFSVERQRYLPYLLLGIGSPRFKVRLQRYVAFLDRLYNAIAAAGGASLIIDSSKSPVRAALLARAPRLRVRVIHLVRDPRGVANSWRNATPRPHSTGERAVMGTYGTAFVASRWTGFVVAFRLLARFGIPTAAVSYEDLCSAPMAGLERLQKHIVPHAHRTDIPFQTAEDIHLGPTHGLAGNPMRFQHGRLPLAADEGWRSNLPYPDRWLLFLVRLLVLGVPSKEEGLKPRLLNRLLARLIRSGRHVAGRAP